MPWVLSPTASLLSCPRVILNWRASYLGLPSAESKACVPMPSSQLLFPVTVLEDSQEMRTPRQAQAPVLGLLPSSWFPPVSFSCDLFLSNNPILRASWTPEKVV